MRSLPPLAGFSTHSQSRVDKSVILSRFFATLSPPPWAQDSMNLRVGPRAAIRQSGAGRGRYPCRERVNLSVREADSVTLH